MLRNSLDPDSEVFWIRIENFWPDPSSMNTGTDTKHWDQEMLRERFVPRSLLRVWRVCCLTSAAS